jgi:RNA-directed DNA polymerase
VQSARRALGKRIPIPIPPELADEQPLLAHLKMSPAELKKIWWYRGGMYSQFDIAKGSGKVRTITAPDRRLKIIERKLAPLLEQLYRVRNPVHGFVPERSVKTNAEAHGRRRFVVNLDLEDFFPTITEKRVVGLLRSLGVEKRVSEIVAHLCCHMGRLPQGAPTSPVLSNMICYRLDTDLLLVAKAARAIYTRYADGEVDAGLLSV